MKYVKTFTAYKKKADLLMDYQLCKAHLGESGSVHRIAEKILLERKHLSNEERRAIHKAVTKTIGVKGVNISVPRLNINKSPSDILSEYVKKNFDNMVSMVKYRGLGDYPLKFRDIIEKVNN